MVELYDIYTEELGGGHFSTFRKNFGNKLFIYAVSRLAAEHLNYDFIVPDNALIRREELTAGQYVTYTFPYKGFTDRVRVESPVKTMDDSDLYHYGDVLKFIEAHPNCKIMVLGYFAKYEYIKPYKDTVRGYYSSLVKEKRNNNDIVLMLRNSRDDGRFVLPDSYYINILEQESFDQVYVCFDHIYKHDSLLKKIAKYNPQYIEGSILDVFSEITSFNKIIAAQGTFSFWACFLSNASTIYWPSTNDGPNSNNNVFGQFVNLKVDDESRYIFKTIDNIYETNNKNI